MWKKKVVAAIFYFFLPILEKILGFLVFEINKRAGAKFFYTYHKRPVLSDDVNYESCFDIEEISYSNVAILIQGPVIFEKNFTLETIKLYRKNYKDIKIVLSTWDDFPESLREEYELFCQLVIQSKPFVSGSHNFNYQKKSTTEGFNYIKSNQNCDYVLKTRSDQRMYSRDAIDSMLRIHSSNPVCKNNLLKGRIIEASMSICKFRPWSMCDMFQFGFLDDLIILWDVEDDYRNRTSLEFSSKKYRVKDIVRENVAEIYLHSSLAKKLNCFDVYNYEKYYSFVRNYFYVIDKELVDIFWYKYNAREYDSVGSKLYDKDQTLSMIRHSDYMNIDNFKLSSELERYLERYEN